MKTYYNDKRIKGPSLKEGDKVYLFRRNIKTKKPSSKLNYKKLGPFKIKRKISDSNYELILPPGVRLHPIFHISLLEPAPKNTRLSTTEEVDSESEEYEVERILDSRQQGRNVEYLVKWKNYEQEENTWEPVTHLR